MALYFLALAHACASLAASVNIPTLQISSAGRVRAGSFLRQNKSKALTTWRVLAGSWRSFELLFNYCGATLSQSRKNTSIQAYWEHDGRASAKAPDLNLLQNGHAIVLGHDKAMCPCEICFRTG